MTKKYSSGQLVTEPLAKAIRELQAALKAAKGRTGVPTERAIEAANNAVRGARAARDACEN